MTEPQDILDKPIKGEFVWYDKDKQIYCYQNGTQLLGTFSLDPNTKFKDSEMKYYWIRECRHKYYVKRHGENYRMLFSNPVHYWADKLINTKNFTETEL